MRTVYLFLALCSCAVVADAQQESTVATGTALAPHLLPDSRTFFPRNWIRGYSNFEVAPSHNEPDLGRCMFPQPVSAGGTASTCAAYARYMMSGYLEVQPFGRTPARHLFFFFEPRFSFGRNLPQVSYSSSISAIAYERAVGAGFELPRNFELRVTQHQVDWLGKYSSPVGTADLHTNGPYGLYTTVGVRWSFGGYGRQASGSAY